MAANCHGAFSNSGEGMTIEFRGDVPAVLGSDVRVIADDAALLAADPRDDSSRDIASLPALWGADVAAFFGERAKSCNDVIVEV